MSQNHSFVNRHVGPRTKDINEMLSSLRLHSLDELIESTLPQSIRLKEGLSKAILGEGRSESELLMELKKIAEKNKVFRSYLGTGYSDCVVPAVIQRNILENPRWYTQYTPYQAEISQGRLEALINFQTLICDLTGLPISNGSLLDEATAAAEAMHMAYAIKGGADRRTFFVSELCHPQTIAVIKTRAEPIGIEVVVGKAEKWMNSGLDSNLFGALLQYPTTDGMIHDYRAVAEQIHASSALCIVAADLLALTLIESPGEWGADIAVGSAQRFGVPMGFGGPHAAYLSTRDEFKRQIPGRLVGTSKDVDGKVGYRLALQTREQHIRRDKATSNICTAQVLLAIMASMYAVYHGPEGLREIAERIHRITFALAGGLRALGFDLGAHAFFDTLRVSLASEAELQALFAEAHRHQINLRRLDARTVSISLDETTSEADAQVLLEVFAAPKKKPAGEISKFYGEHLRSLNAFKRATPYLTHPVFHQHRSESQLLRYMNQLQNRDLSLAHSMIPLGSCTMKLNATAEMLPVSWPEFSKLHPFAPAEQTEGYREMISDLERMLAEITGFDSVSLQPNAGSQGEYAGLLAIRKFHQSKGQGQRNICLIPQSAHGTNPATAAMNGMQVIVVACDSFGNVDVSDLKAKALAHSKNLAALMVTYPSTHGVFEEAIREICEVVHAEGGQVYMDGANMNAQVGLCRPGDFGPDVCHLNLHKTFCIPHGGGGPGMGPIAVAKHLRLFLPSHPIVDLGGKQSSGPVSAAPWGSASILPISWMYIRMMGAHGLKKATEVAILNANYIARRLESHYPVLYKGKKGLVAHECIIDLRPIKAATGIEVEDVAKRLMDYGFHAPTVSFPVAGTMMIEPTESEDKAELDRFIDAMTAIREEIRDIELGRADRLNNVLKRAPHTAQQIAAETWDRPYSRGKGAFPAPWVAATKFWPPIGRIDNVYGERNLFCTCPPLEG